MIGVALASLVLWTLYLCLFIPLAVAGLVIGLPLSFLGLWSTRPSFVEAFRDKAGDIRVWAFGWLTWLWGNEEDGVSGPQWWRDRTGVLPVLGKPTLRQRLARGWSTYRWSFHRNPVNNLRFLPLVCPVLKPNRVKFRRFGNGFLAWQGVYAGLMLFPVIRGRVFRFWLGWKIKPEDVNGVPTSDFRAHGCGFAIQFKRI